MAQRVSVLRQLSHMASLAQNQNQSHKTISKAGEDFKLLEAEWLHCITENWTDQMVLREPDGNSTGGRWTLPLFTFPDSFLFQPFYTTCCLSRSSLLPLCAFDYAGHSPHFPLLWPHQGPGHPAYLTLLSFPTLDLVSFFFLPHLLLSYWSSQAILNLAQASPPPESLLWSLIQFRRPFSGFLQPLCAFSTHPTVQ